MFKSKFIKDKNYLLLFFGNLVSGVGSRVYGFGVSLFLLDLTNQASATAIYVAVWSVIMFAFAPIAATFTDRWINKARILYMTDFGRGICYTITAVLVSLSMAYWSTATTQLIVYVAVIFIGIQTAFFSPAVTALTPQIVERDELVSASSIMQITGSIQNIAGLLLGALLYLEFGIVVLMLINAGSFIMSAVSEMFIKLDHVSEAEKTASQKEKVSLKQLTSRIYQDLKTAIIYLFKSGKPVLMVTFIVLISATLVAPWFSIGVPYLFKEYFSFTNFEPEYILASTQFVESIGVILMSLIVAQIASKLKIYQLFRVGGALFSTIGVIYFLVIRAFDFSVITQNAFIFIYIGVNFVAGMVNATINAPLNASLQKYIEPKMIGKVSTLINSFSGILFPITALIVGALIDTQGIYQPILLMIFAMLLITLVAFKSKELKKLT